MDELKETFEAFYDYIEEYLEIQGYLSLDCTDYTEKIIFEHNEKYWKGIIKLSKSKYYSEYYKILKWKLPICDYCFETYYSLKNNDLDLENDECVEFLNFIITKMKITNNFIVKTDYRADKYEFKIRFIHSNVNEMIILKFKERPYENYVKKKTYSINEIKSMSNN